MSHRSASSQLPVTGMAAAIPACGCARSPAPRRQAAPGRPVRLDARPCRPAGAHRTGRVLDHRRLAGGDGRMVGRDRHLFRIPRRRADPPARAPGADAIRLRGPHRRSARPGRPAREPAVARPGAVREQARTDHAPPDAAGVALLGALHPARHRPRPARSSRRRAPARPRCIAPQSAPKPSPINDTVILVPPPEREARLESRTPFNAGVRLAALQTQRRHRGRARAAAGLARPLRGRPGQER